MEKGIIFFQKKNVKKSKQSNVFLYGLDDENVPQFYKSYPRVYMDETLWVDDGERVEFEAWMKLRRNK